MTYRKQQANVGAPGTQAFISHLAGQYNNGPTNNFRNLSVPGAIPLTLPSGNPTFALAFDPTVEVSNSLIYGPSMWVGSSLGALVRYDSHGDVLNQVPLDNEYGAPIFVIDIIYANNKIWAVSDLGIHRVNNSFQSTSVEATIPVTDFTITGAFSSLYNSWLSYDLTNNYLIFYNGYDRKIYTADPAFTTLTGHTINTSGVTGFQFLYPDPNSTYSDIKGTYYSGHLYVPALGASNHLWIIKIETTNFTTVTSLDTGVIPPSTSNTYNIALDDINNLLFVSGTTGIVRVDLGSFTVTQTLTTVTDGGFIAVDNATCVTGNTTRIDSPSNNMSLPQSNITVQSAGSYPISGTIFIYTSSGIQTITYTGKSGNILTGCTGGTGTLTYLNPVGDATTTNHTIIVCSHSTNQFYQIKTTNTTMVLNNTIPFNAPSGYLLPQSAAPQIPVIVAYNQLSSDYTSGSFIFGDSGNDVLYEFIKSTANQLSLGPAVYFGVGTTMFWSPSNILTNSANSVINNYTVSFNEAFVSADTTSGSFTVTLPFGQNGPTGQNTVAYPVAGEFHVIVDATGSFATHNLTVSGGGANIWFGGVSAATIVLSTNGQAVTFYFTGTVWIAK